MSTTPFTENEETFLAVMGRLKLAINSKSSAHLAEMIGLSGSGYANLKKRGSIPWGRVIELSSSRNVSVDWLITGEGPMHRTPPPAPTPPPEPKPPEPPKKPVLRLVEMPKRPDSRLAMMLTWLESWWVKANSDERVWCDIQMTRCFPEYKDYRQAAESENDLEGGLDGA